MEWTTRLDYTPLEIHTAWFVPNGWPGKGPTVSLGLPECELIITMLDRSGEPVSLVNQPKHNKNAKLWIQSACEEASAFNAALTLNCDTPSQLKLAVKRVEANLRNYKRMPLERFYEASSRRDSTN